jgi:hypothetical protein
MSVLRSANKCVLKRLMIMNPDFEEFFELLNDRGVEFLLIGGVAYNYYAPPRATKDVDVWVRPTPENMQRLVAAIGEFGFPIGELNPNDFLDSNQILMLGRVPNRIDVIFEPLGIDWPGTWSRRGTARYGRVHIPIVSKEDLISSKRAAARPRDLADVSTLESIPDEASSD